jgi:uncharacterized membrane protein (UPF0127 family)
LPDTRLPFSRRVLICGYRTSQFGALERHLMHKRFAALGRVLAGILLELVALACAASLRPAMAVETQILEIASKTGVHSFVVELATTEAERARGLMYRKSLPAGRGMLFDFDRDQPVAMWMKNTYVSLDMIFIRSDGRIARIAEHTQPLSERIIPSGSPVRAVLEVVGGTAARLGIAPGDLVAHPMFGKR